MGDRSEPLIQAAREAADFSGHVAAAALRLPPSLVDRACALARRGRALLGVTGPPGAGKSTLATALVERVCGHVDGDPGAVLVPMDGFHLADLQLARLGLADRKGAPETFDDGGFASLVARLRQADEPVVYAPGFERELEQPVAASIAVPRSARLVVVEGNYLLARSGAWPRARSAFDEVWYLDVPAEVRRERLRRRHVAFGKSPPAAAAWVARSDEANARGIAATRADADLVVDGLALEASTD